MPLDQLRTALAQAILRPRSADEPPEWLLPTQRESFARALAALRRHGTACVADPVGSGKTYVALAVASVWNRSRPTACLVPAILVEQWAAVAGRLGVPVDLHTHERMSRGKPLRGDARLVVIDESHRFRVPTTRRYRSLAPWLVGKQALLLTGTPVVNRPADILHQLRLAGRDDTLSVFGVPSLATLLGGGEGHPALSRLVIVGSGGAAARGRPRRIVHEVRADDAAVDDLVLMLDALRLSSQADVAALVRVGLLRALASSPAAFSASLRRYRTLLRHAADAAAEGRPVTRHHLRLAVGADDAQLVFWSLLDATGDGAVELDPRDLPAVERLVTAASRPRPDPKADRLAALLGDRRRSIVFVTHRATVAYLGSALRGLRVAWCTGSGAGIGHVRATRRAVLAAFDPAAEGRAARIDVLVTTDVAAEGLDLQRAERIVHYDLPWTPMRLRQREGRALRLGSLHERVEVARFHAPPAIERRLGMTRALRRKHSLPERLGLDQRGESDDAGRTADAAVRDPPVLVCAREATVAPEAGPGGRACTGPAAARRAAGAPELIAAGTARASDGAEADTIAVWRRSDGRIVDDPAAIFARLRQLADRAVPITDGRAAALIDDATCLLRRSRSMPAAHGSSITQIAPAELIARLTALAAAAARARDDTRLAQIDGALRFLRRGHTAGEASLVTLLSRCSDAELVARLEHLPPERPAGGAWRPTLMVIVAHDVEE